MYQKMQKKWEREEKEQINKEFDDYVYKKTEKKRNKEEKENKKKTKD